jgi:hypothetical protein
MNSHDKRGLSEENPSVGIKGFKSRKVIITLAIAGIVFGICFFFLVPEYRFLLVVIYIVMYLLSPLLIYLLSEWEAGS